MAPAVAALLPMLPFRQQQLPDLPFEDAGLAQQAAAWRARQGQLAATLAAALGGQGGGAAGQAPPPPPAALVQELQRANLEALHALTALHVAQMALHEREVERLRALQMALRIPTAAATADAFDPAAVAVAPAPDLSSLPATAAGQPAFPDGQSMTLPALASGAAGAGDAPPATPAGGPRAAPSVL